MTRKILKKLHFSNYNTIQKESQLNIKLITENSLK